MTVLSGILLGLAIADVLFAVVQLFMLSGMKLIVYEMTPLAAWLFVVGPSVVVLILAIISMSLEPSSHPHSLPGVLIAGYCALLIVMLFQAAATKPILDKRREWDKGIEKRNRAVHHNGS